MATYCVPPQLAAILKTKVSKESIAKLFELDSAGRRDFWSQFVDKENAKLINTEFEKAMISSRKTAMKDWAERTFSTEEKKVGKFKSVVDKINELDEASLLTPEKQQMFLEDLVAEKLGARVTAQEAQGILSRTDKLKSLSGSMDKELPSLPSMEYFKAKRELDNYLDGLTPSSQLKVATSVIGRATMLASVKSPLVNIESNTVNAITESFARRVELLSKNNLLPRGSKNTLVSKYIGYVNRVYAETGYDLTRMLTLDTSRKTLGEEMVTSQGPGAVRKVGQVYTDIVFNKLMTAPDVAFASFHFTDAANLKATAIARSEGLSGPKLQARVEELFLDATRIEPKTPLGRMIRDKARLEAERGTYTDKNNYSKLSLALRSALNQASGDLRIGDTLMPFVQVPATVVGTAFDYSGILLPVELLARGKNALNAKRLGEMDAFKNAFDAKFQRKAVRAGLGITLAFIVSSWFSPDEYIGEYPTSEKERQLLALKNANTNSLKVGNKWISLDYFGPLAAPLTGMMYAKKYGQNPIDAALKYAQGVGLQTSRIPGVKQFYNIYQTLQDFNPAKNSPEDLTNNFTNFLVDLFRSRTIPALISDTSKGTDTYERQTNSAMDRLIASIPGFRQKMLEEKLSVFGEPIKTEGFWSTMLAGARLKSATDEPVVNELNRLSTVGQLPSITDVAKTSPRAKELKAQIGDSEFKKFYIEFGQQFRNDIADIISTDYYKQSTDEEKKKLINKIKNKNFDSYLLQYGYEKPQKP